ncbi:flagellar hook-associated protein FlgK [Sporosarcina luteola]|uniref:flagellar hook-associated protein FlgK n=1 Tax=Sporosarcina luteola TaxID=582850 RepID=UPI00203D7D65|nr:flagellar hook-associated protein FlgK [Sporosarcina luteola]MCM3743886.1 flagellar hook-associated protein FlgK [Sporosarcina luteola]
MRSTFMGLETNKRGMFTQQSALYTTGHNISNANTPGYTRQRVNMQATAGFPGVGLNTPTMPGFLGTGVEAGSIQRIRDTFVDQQFRQESNKLGYWESRSKAISQMEDVLNEPSDYGLQKSLSQFWQSLQDLAVNPENNGARAVVVERGMSVAESFNYMDKSLKEIQTNLGHEINATTHEVNSLLKQISDINRQIQEIEPNGYLPNDLYDARDVLIDQLSEYFPIETNYDKSGGRALSIAEGSVTVSVKMQNGEDIVLVSGREHVQIQADPNPLLKVDPDGTVTNQPIAGLKISALSVSPDVTTSGATRGFSDFKDNGKVKSLMNSYGTSDGKGLYPEMFSGLDRMAKAFAEEFNKVHGLGTDLTGNKGEDFFIHTDKDIEFTAGNISVSSMIKKNPNLIAASDSEIGSAEEGNGKNAKALGNIQFKGIPGADGLNGSTVQTFFQGIIGELGVNGQQAERMTGNTAVLKASVEHRRASISSVSLDEEMTDMIKYQQAYNASARMITVIDETLDKIINGMGIGGR